MSLKKKTEREKREHCDRRTLSDLPGFGHSNSCLHNGIITQSIAGGRTEERRGDLVSGSGRHTMDLTVRELIVQHSGL